MSSICHLNFIDGVNGPRTIRRLSSVEIKNINSLVAEMIPNRDYPNTGNVLLSMYLKVGLYHDLQNNLISSRPWCTYMLLHTEHFNMK